MSIDREAMAPEFFGYNGDRSDALMEGEFAQEATTTQYVGFDNLT